MNNPIEDFRHKMTSADLRYAGQIIADGQIHRIKVSGDRQKNSWYVLHLDTPAAGAFGCWKRGIKMTWCARSLENLSYEEKHVIHLRWQLAEELRKKNEADRQAKAKAIAAWILERGKSPNTHAYLAKKNVKAFGNVRAYRKALVIPLVDADGQLHSLQFISADGSKRFLSGGRCYGCFFIVADRADSALVICEGYATGATIHEATGLATVCAMNCGNLLAVAQALRKKFPAREILIAADNDQFTDKNPGLTHATEAATAINARLAVPQFADVASKPTDFNDLAVLVGLSAVKQQIEAASKSKETDEEILKRLAALPPLEYERQRDQLAKTLGWRVAVLDKAVEERRTTQATCELQGRAVNLPEIELWPEAVNGAEVLSEVAETFARYVALPQGAADALALWCAHAHGFNFFPHSPRLNICSPEKGCGKTTLRDVVSLFVPRPLLTENLTVAVLFRVIESHKPTIVADECDAWLRDNEELRGMLNAGHRQSDGYVLRCVGDGNEVRAFNVFAPAILCGIGSLPGTLHDRSIVVQLERAKPGELRERFDSRRISGEQELCRKLARFVADNAAQLQISDPKMPERAFNRLADNWRPLFALAEVAGGNWLEQATSAFMKLNGRDDLEAQGIGTILLADIAEIFDKAGVDKIPSAELTNRLAAIEGREWAEWGKSRSPISANQLAKLLHRFNISPRTIKLPSGNTAKGYHRELFDEAFQRYLPQSSSQNVTP